MGGKVGVGGVEGKSKATTPNYGTYKWWLRVAKSARIITASFHNYGNRSETACTYAGASDGRATNFRFFRFRGESAASVSSHM